MVSFLAQLMQPLKTGKWSQFLLGGGSPVPEPMPSVCVSLRSIQPHLSLSDKHYICHSGGKGVESFSVFPRARTQTQWSLDTNSCPLPNRPWFPPVCFLLYPDVCSTKFRPEHVLGPRTSSHGAHTAATEVRVGTGIHLTSKAGREKQIPDY